MDVAAWTGSGKQGSPPGCPWGDEDLLRGVQGGDLSQAGAGLTPGGIPRHLSSPSEARAEPYNPIPWEQRRAGHLFPPGFFLRQRKLGTEHPLSVRRASEDPKMGQI